MPPHPQMSLAQQLMVRALVSKFWDHAYDQPLVNWGTSLHDRYLLPHFVWTDLGDVIDDYCPRCRLLLNHDVTSLFQDAVAKVTCRTCHNAHDYRHAQVPARRKSKQQGEKQSLLEQVMASMPKPPEPPPAPPAAARKKRDLWAEVERIKGQKKG